MCKERKWRYEDENEEDVTYILRVNTSGNRKIIKW